MASSSFNAIHFIDDYNIFEIFGILEDSETPYSGALRQALTNRQTQDALILKFISTPLAFSILSNDRDIEVVRRYLDSLTIEDNNEIIQQLNHLKRLHLQALHRISPQFEQVSLALLSKKRMKKLQKLDEKGHKTKGTKVQRAKHNAYNFNQAYFLEQFPLLKHLDGACFGLTLNWLLVDNFHRQLTGVLAEGPMHPILQSVMMTQFSQYQFHSKHPTTTHQITGDEVQQFSQALFEEILAKQKQDKKPFKILLLTHNHAMGIRVRTTDAGKIQIQIYDSNHGKWKPPVFNPNLSTRHKNFLIQGLSEFIARARPQQLGYQIFSEETLREHIEQSIATKGADSPLTNALEGRESIFTNEVDDDSLSFTEDDDDEYEVVTGQEDGFDSGNDSDEPLIEVSLAQRIANKEYNYYCTKNTLSRSHFFKPATVIPSVDRLSPTTQQRIEGLTQDALKSELLIILTEKIINYKGATPLADNQAWIDRVILSSAEARILNRSQGFFTHITPIRTDSRVALDTIIEKAKEGTLDVDSRASSLN